MPRFSLPGFAARLLLPALVLSCSACEAQPPDSSACRIVLSRAGAQNAYPRLSKEGKNILYQSNETGHWQLNILSLDDGKIRPLLRDSFNDNFPDWSADNRRVAFVSDRDGNEEIYVVNTDGSGLQRITSDSARDIHPYFSPDGQYLLFNSTRGNGSLDIYRYTFAGGKTERLTDSDLEETCARYSPDMKKIVFLRNGMTSDDIYEMDMATFVTENVTHTPSARDGWPVYGNNGKWIYYSSGETGTFCIYRIRPDGSRKQQLTFAAPGEEDARVFVSPDGKTMIFNKGKNGTLDIRLCSIPLPGKTD